MTAKLAPPMIEVLRTLASGENAYMPHIKAVTYRSLQNRGLIDYVNFRRVITDAGRTALANLDAPAKTCGTVTTTGRHRRACTNTATGADGMCTKCRNFFAPKPYTCRACGTEDLYRGVDAPLCVDHKRANAS